MRRKRSRIQELRQVIDCMPLHTRAAMLEGVRTNEIIAGAYTDRDGGVCPMLAAHRCGGRTDYDSFAKAWDRFTGVVKSRSRLATQRELRILIAHLEDSLMAEQERPDLGEAIAEHRTTVARTRTEELTAPATPRPGDPDRSRELSHRAGWSWLRPFRRLDEYERALDLLHAEAELLDVERRERERELV
jgi:hypothetical protein